MGEVSRRSVLKAGGAVGLAALALRPIPTSWAWSSSRSMAGGSLKTVPPEGVWDAAVDRVVHRLFVDEGIETIQDLNALLRSWHHNGGALPGGLPADLHALLEDIRRAPAWLDPTKVADGFEFYERRGSYTGLLYGLGSGIMSCAIPDEARAVYHSKGGEDMRDRVGKTAKLGYDIGTEDAFAETGQMIVTCIKTRLAHSAVRHLITSSARWKASGDTPAPISQRDLMITWHSLATFIHRTLERWGVDMDPRQADGFLHVWQLTAHFLGIDHVYIPATWADARAQSDMTLDPVLAATPEGVSLAGTLLSMAGPSGSPTRRAVDAMARYMVGTNNAGQSIADMLEIPRDPYWDRAVAGGWPSFVASRERGLLFPGSETLYWTFDELLRLGVLWGTNEGPGPIYIEMPTANRSEASYSDAY